MESLYASVLAPERLGEFCERLVGATGSHVGAIMVQDMQRHDGRLDLVVGANPLEAARYEREFAADNLWLQRGAAQLATGATLDSDDFVSRAELHRSRYYNEYLREGDVEQSIALCAHFDGKNVVTATVCRSGRLQPYTAEHLALLRQVTPHWVNAYALQRRLAQLEQRVDALEHALELLPMAMFMLDRHGRVIRTNAAAEHLLAAGRLLRTPVGLSAPGPDAAPLKALVRDAAIGIDTADGRLRRQGQGVLRNARHQVDLVVAIHPLPPSHVAHAEAAVMFVQALTATSSGGLMDLLRRAFELTAAEAALATALYRHADLAHAAQACGITPATAKTRLQSIFAKTGEHGQAALMRLLAALAQVSEAR